MAAYIALLRGINVGGKNLIKMGDLRGCFSKNGFEDVSTFIASGNVLFRAPRQGQASLGKDIEAMLSREFGYDARIVVVTEASLRRTVRDAPRGFGKKPDTFLSDVIFLRPPLTAALAMNELSTREGVDEAFPGRGVVYFTRRKAEATRSRLGRISQSPIYPDITIRSWSTTEKLVGKLDELKRQA